MNSLIAMSLILAALIALACLVMPKRRTPKLSAKKVLSAPEQVLYHRLKAVLDGKLEVLPQVSFSRFVTTGKDRATFNRISRKTADYVITDAAFNVHSVIELDDSSHNLKKDASRDALLTIAGIRTIRWNVKQLPSDTEIRQTIFGVSS